MKLVPIKDACSAVPFRPFTVRFDTGNSIHIGHPDYAFLTPGSHGTIVLVHPDGGIQVVDLDHIVALEYESDNPATPA